jgi:hypothetical protein
VRRDVDVGPRSTPSEFSNPEGYAVSGTDTGRTGGSLDAGWALGHPEKVADFVLL